MCSKATIAMAGLIGLSGCSGMAPGGPMAPMSVASQMLRPADSGHWLPPKQTHRSAKPRKVLPAGPAKFANAPPKARKVHRPHLSAGDRSQLVQIATDLLGTAGLQRRDFVDHVLHAGGMAISTDANRPFAPQAWRAVQRLTRSELRPGDLVFFRNTNDLNGNGKPDDGVTWVALVEQVHPGRLIVIGQRAGRVRRMALSTERPNVTRDASGKVVNTRIVKWPNESKAWTTGRCFAGFGRP